ncbi:MAG: hypothetical protein ACRCVU_07455 [Flavobacterium sp.]
MKKVILGVVVLLLFFSCDKNYDYNESVALTYVHYRNQLDVFRDDWSKDVEISFKRESLQRLEVVIDSCAKVTYEITPVPKAEVYHQTLINLYALAKDELVPAYKESFKLEESVNTEENRYKYYDVLDLVDLVYDRIEKLEDVSIAEQKKFAKAVNMKLASEM